MTARSRTTVALAFALGLVAVAHSASAQSAALVPPPASVATVTDVVAAPVTAVAAGPTLDAASVGVRHEADASPTPARRSGSPGVPLMIVGGAAILVGLVVGGGAGNAIAVGGAVAGLVGLYEYLQ